MLLPSFTPQKLDEIVAKRQTIAGELRTLIDGEVRFERHDRMLYATDASMYQVEPLGVVCPRTIADAEKVVRYCIEHELPILPRGGGTSLAGQTVNSAIVIDFSAFCRGLIDLDAVNRTCRVEPGIVLDHLNAALSKHRLMFGPDVATSGHANLGGMIGNNSAGAHSILYGRTVENLLGLDVLVPEYPAARLRLRAGASETDPAIRDLTQRIANVILPREREIEKRFPKIVRHVDGYNLDLTLMQLRDSTPGTFDRVNLAHLVCGSEGTLAVTLEAQLKLVPIPKRTGLAIVAFRDVETALASLVSILETRPAAVELIDDVVINVAKANREYCKYVDLLPCCAEGIPAGAVLYVEYFADNDQTLNDQFATLETRVDRRAMQRYTQPQEMGLAWKLRKAGEPLLHGLHGDRKPLTFVEDVAVDPAKLAAFVKDFRTLVARHNTTAAYYAHASVGCLHIRPMVNMRDPKDADAMQRMAEEACDLAVKYGGALSGEHGDGRVRSHLLKRFYGSDICDAFRAIKAIFDPRNLLNPGNIVQPPPMLEYTRLRPREEFVNVPQVKTFFRYEREHGFGEAVEMCNGAGVCRKMKGGTMCPSYRGTLDERHATRGRGNALRLAITGQFSSDGRTPHWNDPETRKTLDLCLSCKACKSECPSNVDIAKLKAEYTAQGFANGGRIPFSSRMFGNIRTLNKLGSMFPALANAACGFAPLKYIADKMMGLHPKRSLPRFEKSLHHWMRTRPNPRTKADAPAVILFPDCFTVYNEPRIGMAAVRVLETLGYRVVVPKDVGCCGRAMISTGQLGQAAAMIANTSRNLMEVVQREKAIGIVGCEPSCISAIKDEWLELEMGVDVNSLRALSQKSMLIEQFIESHAQSRGIAMPRASDEQKTVPVPVQVQVLLHAHCHQKALWGAESSAAILRRLFGDRLQVLDTGCCGMAGQFGYHAEHYDLSMKIGEMSLFPPLREHGEAIVVAPGTSCRQQIHDGVNREALHPIEIIDQVLNSH